MNYEMAQETASFIKSRFDEQLRIALVLGSGLGGFADRIQQVTKIPYEEIPHFARSTVQGHAGFLVIGRVENVPVIVQQGRFHYYEGYEISQVVFPIRVFGLLGIKSLILTNAAGSIRTSNRRGTLLLIRDHINLMGVNPLRGVNDERFGPRFPDMTEVYCRDYQNIASEEAEKIAQERFQKGIDKEFRRILRRGVYCALSGPTYETPAEVRMLRLLGADAVGMSTVPEAMVAHQMGMKVLAISCLTNMAAGIDEGFIRHEEVMETGAQVAEIFEQLLRRVILRIKEFENY
ncbi:MAG: purine-nucleoside phosphorylase [Pyrinomonadaceae bacterium]|nr:purine-nucleoside phosphorylase [Pyrinomonadaceae bacterium]MCX7640626.1 purine-nucleoside phosphorylase [Pyrinomonadaceae bacterium]MDW8305146.1 purine-nucleoside phosphorylase [Acidobacteriota bacterium]